VGRTLLEKSRAINRILQKIIGNPVEFGEMAAILAENLECSVIIVGRRGHIIGYSFSTQAPCKEIDGLTNYAEHFPESFNQEFINSQETQANIQLDEKHQCIFNYAQPDCTCTGRTWLITPIFGGARRIGTMILSRNNRKFSDEDIVLAEYGSIVVANEVMRMRTERIEEESCKKAAVQIAVATLSYSEKEAIEAILAELNAPEGLLIASKVADKVGITRSVIVSALRKFASAGVIESRSLGMKGTYIKILNDYIFEELKKQ